MAAVLSSGSTAHASHRTAAHLLGLEGTRRPEGRPEVSVRRPAIGDRRVAIVHEVRRWGPGDAGRLDGIPVTSVARTIVDLAGVVSPSILETVVDAALRDGRTSVEHLRRHLARLGGPGVAGVAALRALLDEGAARPESWLERRALELFARAGLPAPEVQRVVAGRDGALARVDLAFAGGRIVVELNGHRTHSTRRQRQRDHERANRLALVGITVLQFTYEDVRERPEHVVAIVVAALRAAA